MNKVILMGRLTANPDVSYTQGAEPIARARYNIAVDRPKAGDGQQETQGASAFAAGKRSAARLFRVGPAHGRDAVSKRDLRAEQAKAIDRRGDVLRRGDPRHAADAVR